MTFSIQENRKKKKSLVTLERSRWWPTARQGRLAAGARAERGGRQHGPREAVVGVVRARASGRQALCSLRTLEPAERGAAGQAGGASGRCAAAPLALQAAPRPEPARGGGAPRGRGSASCGTPGRGSAWGGAPRESRMCRFHGEWRSARVSRHHRVSVEGGLCRRPAEPRRALEPWARAQLASAAVPSPRGRVPAAPSLRVCVVRAHGPSSDGLPGGPGQP